MNLKFVHQQVHDFHPTNLLLCATRSSRDWGDSHCDTACIWHKSSFENCVTIGKTGLQFAAALFAGEFSTLLATFCAVEKSFQETLRGVGCLGEQYIPK